MMYKIVLIALCVVLSPLAFVSAEPKKSAKHDVAIRDMKFDPDKLEIAPGDSVVWTNQDDRDHTVSAKDGSFKSDNLKRGTTFEHIFKKPGKFNYSCSYHPRMKGTIVVKGE